VLDISYIPSALSCITLTREIPLR